MSPPTTATCSASSAPSPTAPASSDLSHRGVVTVSGEDRLSWLHLLLTQHVSELPAGEATEALILSAHGHIEHALYLVDDGTTVWAHVEPGTQDALIAYLESMKFFYRVEVADRTGDIAVVHLPAGSIAEVPDGVVVRETPYGRDVFLPRAELEEFAAGHGPAAGLLAYEALRVEHHRPRLGFETDHRTIPHELGWIGTAVHLQKGLLPGPGDGRPRAEPGQAAAPAGLPCTWTAARSTCRYRAPSSASRTRARRAARSASSRRRYATTSWARWPWPWSSATSRSTPASWPGRRRRPRETVVEP